jgi:uncharacterized membrane protein YhaH (DUF805 family)
MKRLVSLAAIDSGPHNPQEQPPVRRTGKNPLAFFASALKKYADFGGRARRAEFWYFMLFNCIIQIVLLASAIIANEKSDTGSLILTAIFLLYVYLACMPFIALAVRRIHDAGKNGWFTLVPVYNIILLFIPGTSGPNRFGPDPKQADLEAPDKLPPGMMILRILSILIPVWYVGVLVFYGGDRSNDITEIFSGLFVLLFVAAHAITAFLQGVKYQCSPVKISVLIYFVLIGLSVCAMVFLINVTSPKTEKYYYSAREYLEGNITEGFGIADIESLEEYENLVLINNILLIIVLVALLYSIVLAVAMEIWSFRVKKNEVPGPSHEAPGSMRSNTG